MSHKIEPLIQVKRDSIITFKLTPDEANDFDKFCKAQGYTKSRFLRHNVLKALVEYNESLQH